MCSLVQQMRLQRVTALVSFAASTERPIAVASVSIG